MPDLDPGGSARLRRRDVLLSAGLGAAALALRPGRARAAEPETIRIGTFEETNPTAMLQQAGWLGEVTKAKIQWQDVGSGGAFNTLAAAGGIDVGLGLGTSPAAAGLALGIPYRIVAMCDNIAGAEEMTVRRSANIAKPADFAGRTVAVPFGSTSNFRLNGFLATHGLLGKVKVVYMPPAEMLAAWKRGEIDAGYVWPPAKTKMLQDGGAVFETYRELDKAGYVIGDLIAVSNDFLEKYPDTVAALLRAYGKGVALWQKDRQQAAALTGKATGLNPAEALADMQEYAFITLRQSLSPDWLGPPGAPGRLADILHRTAGFLHEQKSIPQVPPPETFARGIDAAPLGRVVGS